MAHLSSADPIRVGILHSTTGAMATSETPLVAAALMAPDEINQAGGVLGCPLEPVVTDGASEPGQFEQAAHSLFVDWTSMSRKAVLPVLAARNPVHHEGLEQSAWGFYTGSCLNQQVEPALNWLLRRLFLIGSDHRFPRMANRGIREQLKHRQGAVVGEAYVPLGAADFSDLVKTIGAAQPDAVFNTLNGPSNLPFYALGQAQGLIADRMPVLTVSIGELDRRQMGSVAAGHYACWIYFQSLVPPIMRLWLGLSSATGAIASPVTSVMRPVPRSTCRSPIQNPSIFDDLTLVLVKRRV